jgi:N-acetylglucosamine-6-sulfatase
VVGGQAARRFATLASVALLGALVSAVVSVTPAEASGLSRDRVRPNIVLILTDDMRHDELRFLPAVRRLQRSGVTFDRALSADSLCCPARATLLTGKLAHNHKTMGNSPGTFGGYSVFAQNNDIQDLLPQWLHDRGYRTAWIGKYLNGIGGDLRFRQPDWDYFAVPVTGVYSYWSDRFSINGRFRTSRAYRELYTRRLLLDRIRSWAPGKRPFFVLDSTIAPHRSGGSDDGGNFPRPQSIHAGFDPGRLDIRPSVGETDLSDKPVWLQQYAARFSKPLSYPVTLETHRVEALMSVNDTVRDLVRTLRQEHELDRTELIFTSDNGFMLHEHDMSNKNKPYDESVNVPLVVRGPGFRGGGSADQTVSLADVTATIRRLAGVGRPHGADGVALQDVLADPQYFDGRPVEIEGSVAQFPDQATLPTDSIGRFYTGVVWGPYTLDHYQTGDWEFYDRTQDPWELQNSFTPFPSPGSPQALLQQWYATHVDCRGQACNDRVSSP